jgi:protein-disulfide isomerase
MTNGDAGEGRLSRNERREAAREKAKAIRDEQKKKEKRGRYILQGSLILLVVAIIGGVALVISQSIKPASPGPLNMLSDGIVIGEGFTAVRTAALEPKGTPVPTLKDEKSQVIHIQMFLDYLCPICGEFEATNGPLIKTLVTSGAATIEYHPIAILTAKSAGTQYSLRAANAAACVANYSPDQFFDFNAALYTDQPKEGSEGLTDDELYKRAVASGVGAASSIKTCITDATFKSWVQDATNRALTGPIANTDVAAVKGTPTVIVNGARYNFTYPFDADEFSTFVVQAAGENFNDTSTATPTPAP